jgi:hypothetical protein
MSKRNKNKGMHNNRLLMDFQEYKTTDKGYIKEGGETTGYINYHQDWNALISVVDDIHTIIETGYCAEYFLVSEGIVFYLGNIYMSSDIKEAHRGCVDFVKYYNKKVGITK